MVRNRTKHKKVWDDLGSEKYDIVSIYNFYDEMTGGEICRSFYLIEVKEGGLIDISIQKTK